MRIINHTNMNSHDSSSDNNLSNIERNGDRHTLTHTFKMSARNYSFEVGIEDLEEEMQLLDGICLYKIINSSLY